MQPARRHDKSPWPTPRWRPRPGFLYAQVIQEDRRKRMVGVKHRVGFGTMEARAQV
jgi:hypothetical protein